METPARRKMTLAWNSEDVDLAIATLFEKGDPAKYIDFPLAKHRREVGPLSSVHAERSVPGGRRSADPRSAG
jgi:hypothetical protein